MQEIRCTVCGKSFTSQRSTRKYCSDTCRYRAKNLRRSNGATIDQLSSETKFETMQMLITMNQIPGLIDKVLEIETKYGIFAAKAAIEAVWLAVDALSHADVVTSSGGKSDKNDKPPAAVTLSKDQRAALELLENVFSSVGGKERFIKLLKTDRDQVVGRIEQHAIFFADTDRVVDFEWLCEKHLLDLGGDMLCDEFERAIDFAWEEMA